MKKALYLTIALIAASVLTAALAQPAQISSAEQVDLTRVENYLNSMPSLKARFLQIGPDGQTTEGQAWLQRPGRMRFQYDPPSQLLLVAGHGMAIFHDQQLDQTSTIPLSSTPLGLLLADHIHLQGDVTVTRYSHPAGQIQLTLVRSAHPQDGSLSLFFADQPLTLRSWSVVDAQARETRVSLFKISPGGDFDQNLFTYHDSEGGN
jgi:outer membrane lipoprotein-sorting protein